METRIKPTANSPMVSAQLTPLRAGVDGNILPEAGKSVPLKAVPESTQVTKGVESSQAGEVKTELLADRIKISEKAAERLNEALRDRQRDLEFSVDETTGRTILKVIHSESGEVIRQLPPEEVLQIARAFIEGTGSLIDDEA